MQSIKKELLIKASQETAFRVFTERMGDWWPKSHHIGKTPPTDSILEQKVQGRWYSTHEDGTECTIGKVLIWDPYGRVVIAWQVNGNFQYDPDLISEVEVLFQAEEPGLTRVTMEHRVAASGPSPAARLPSTASYRRGPGSAGRYTSDDCR